MNDRVTQLGWVMRIFGVSFVVIILVMFELWPAGFRWGHQHYSPANERMFQAIYVALGICLFRAAKEPLRARHLIDFTILSSVLHGGVMAYDAVVQEDELTHLVGDVPLLFAVAAIFLFLHPNRIAPADVARGSGQEVPS